MALWNFTVDNTSPYLSYSPFVDGPNGWRTWYSQSLYNTVPDQIGRGDSYHIASNINANVTFRFYGSGISLFGTANGTFNVVVDNILLASVNTTLSPLLYSNYNLTEGLHSVTLSALPSPANSSQLGFDFAVTSSPLASNENPPSPLFYDNSNTASLLYLGVWSINNVNGVPNSTISAPFHTTTENGASASLSFTGGSAVVVRGMVGLENGLYSVSLNGITSTFNGSSVWTVPDALLFFRAGLDPSAKHEINITNMNAGTRLCLNSMTVFQHESKVSAISSPSTSATSSHSVNLGIILGPVVGLLIFVIFGGYILYRRRHRHHSIKILTPRVVPFTQGRSGGTENTLPASTTPPYWANSETHLSIRSFSATDSASEANLKKQTDFPMGRHGRSNASLVEMTHLNTELVDDTRFHADALLTSPSSSTTFSNASTSTPFSSRRKPLPTIPVPSYDVALQAPELPSDEKTLEHLLHRHVRRKTQETAPPQYER